MLEVPNAGRGLLSSKLALLPPRSLFSPSNRRLISNAVARSSAPAAPVTNEFRLGPPSAPPAPAASSPDAQPPAGTGGEALPPLSPSVFLALPSILKFASPRASASGPVGVETRDRAMVEGLLRVVGGPEGGADDVVGVGAEGVDELAGGGTTGK